VELAATQPPAKIATFTPTYTPTRKLVTIPEQPSQPTAVPPVGDLYTLRVNAPAGAVIFVDGKQAGSITESGYLDLQVPKGPRKLVAIPPNDKQAPIKRVAIVEGNTTETFEFKRNLWNDATYNMSRYEETKDVRYLTMAKSYFAEILNRYPSITNPTRSDRWEYIQAAYRLANIALEENDPARAEQYFTQMLQEDPKQPIASYGLGKIKLQQKACVQAIEYFENAKKYLAFYDITTQERNSLLLNITLNHLKANECEYKESKAKGDKATELELLNKIITTGTAYLTMYNDIGDETHRAAYLEVTAIVKRAENDRKRAVLGGEE